MSVRSMKYVRLSICHTLHRLVVGGGDMTSYPTKFGRDNNNKEKKLHIGIRIGIYYVPKMNIFPVERSVLTSIRSVHKFSLIHVRINAQYQKTSASPH